MLCICFHGKLLSYVNANINSMEFSMEIDTAYCWAVDMSLVFKQKTDNSLSLCGCKQMERMLLCLWLLQNSGNCSSMISVLLQFKKLWINITYGLLGWKLKYHLFNKGLVSWWACWRVQMNSPTYVEIIFLKFHLSSGMGRSYWCIIALKTQSLNCLPYQEQEKKGSGKPWTFLPPLCGFCLMVLNLRSCSFGWILTVQDFLLV